MKTACFLLIKIKISLCEKVTENNNHSCYYKITKKETVKELLGKKPMLAFCLGHLVMAMAAGAETSKMKFGHHGNQPVKGFETGRVYISAQNHGYVVEAASVEGKDITVTHVALNDNTVEGLKYEGKNAVSVQFLPDVEHTYLLETFVEMMEGRK